MESIIERGEADWKILVLREKTIFLNNHCTGFMGRFVGDKNNDKL